MRLAGDNIMAESEIVSYEKIKHRKRMSVKDKIFYIFIYSFFILFAVITLYPLINMLAYSFNDSLDAVLGGIYILPRKWSLKNYEEVLFEKEGLRRGALVTVSRTVIGTSAALLSNAMLAFIISRKKFLFKSGLSLFWIIAVFAQGGVFPLITTYLLYRFLHLTQNFWVYIVPGLVNIIYVMVLRTYMKSIPDSFEEEAKLEGAGYMKIFWYIITPICKPVYSAIALFIATYHWNSWFDALIYNRMKPELTTLQYETMKLFVEISVPSGVVSFRSRSATPYSVKCAAYLLTMVPIIVAYPFFQKHFVSGLKIKGIKD